MADQEDPRWFENNQFHRRFSQIRRPEKSKKKADKESPPSKFKIKTTQNRGEKSEISIIKSINRKLNQSKDHSRKQSIDQSGKQSKNSSTNPSKNRSTNPSTNCSKNLSNIQSTNRALARPIHKTKLAIKQNSWGRALESLSPMKRDFRWPTPLLLVYLKPSSIYI